MRAYELERWSIFSIDGGESWYIVIVEPRDGDSEDTVFLAAPVDNPGLRNTKEFKLNNYDFVWEPNEEDVRLGASHFRVKE